MPPRTRFTSTIACLAVLFATRGTVAFAQNGTWNVNAGGDWITATNWNGNVTASGSGNAATFSMTGSGSTRTIVVDDGRTIGNITRNWAANNQLIFSTGNLTLAGTTPTITNNDAGSGSRIEFTNIVTGTNGLATAGTGAVRLTNTGTNYTGNTSVTGTSVLDLHTIANANIGGGSGRNITVATGAGVRFNALSNTFLNRIVETSDEFTVMTGTITSGAIDLGSSVGANLPNAFLGNWAATGGMSNVSGSATITPGSNGYRFGSTASNGLLGIALNLGNSGGATALTIGGNRVQLTGNNTFTGETVVRDGARLVFGSANALANSPLNTGTPSNTGVISFANGSAGGTTPGAVDVPNAVVGGLTGSRNLSSTINQGTATAVSNGNGGNNTPLLALNSITGITLNPGAGQTHTYSGAIANVTGSSTAFALTMAASAQGTQILTGNNTYSGTTTISGGTLLINGNSTAATGAMTVASGAVLGGTGTIGGALNMTGSSSLFVADLLDPLAVSGTVDIYAGFGVDDLAGMNDWSLVADGTYTLIAGTLGGGVFDGLANNSEGTAHAIGGGRSAYFQQGSLQLVVVPEPTAIMLAGFGIAAAVTALRRRRGKAQEASL